MKKETIDGPRLAWVRKTIERFAVGYRDIMTRTHFVLLDRAQSQLFTLDRYNTGWPS